MPFDESRNSLLVTLGVALPQLDQAPQVVLLEHHQGEDVRAGGAASTQPPREETEDGGEARLVVTGESREVHGGAHDEDVDDPHPVSPVDGNLPYELVDLLEPDHV